MNYEKKLQDLGLILPDPPKPLASYLPFVQNGNLLFLSGMLPLKDGKLVLNGKVGEGLNVAQGQEAAKIALLNALAVIKLAIGSLDLVEQIVRMSLYVACSPNFTEQPSVANGASDLLVEIFGERGRHARLALAAPVLPLDAPVELELIVSVSPMGPMQDDFPPKVL